MSKYKLFSQYLDVYRKKTHLTVGEYKNIIDYTNRIFHSITPEHISLIETDSFTSYDVWQKDHEFVIDELSTPKKPVIHIDEKISTIADLLAVIDKYPVREDVEYNINMLILHNISSELRELESMIGMTHLKKNILDQILYFLQGFSGSGDYKHIVIYGSPGTGKTDIAKILGNMYSKMGVVKAPPSSMTSEKIKVEKKTHHVFKKATRTDLVAGYLGQTAIKTRALINECLGGVLFIDEIYSLGDDSFSKECADTLCEALSDHKDGLIVIVAGYETCVNERFFKLNPGLESRFSWRFTIDDYTSSEVWQIFKKKVEIQKIGVRHGEKMAEALLGSEERSRAIDGKDYFRVPVDGRNLDYQIYFDKGQNSLPSSEPYTSSNTKQLSLKEAVDLISNLPEFVKYKAEIK